LRTISGRQGKYINEYADYIQQLPRGQAGKLRIGEDEKHTAVRRRLVKAAQAMNVPLIIKRSGNELYFWRENGTDEQPGSKRRYTRSSRRGSPGGSLPQTTEFSAPETGEPGQESTPLDQAFVEIE
jgi:hypothetical protein